MTKKVYVEAILISEEDGQNSLVKFDDMMGSVAVDPKNTHEIPEPVELEKWASEIIENNEGDSIFGFLEILLESKEFKKNVYEEEDNYDFQAKAAMAFLTGNYVVKKEPKYIVKVGMLLFQKFDENIACFVIDDSPGAEPEAYHYTDKNEAEHTAIIIGGEVEKVEIIKREQVVE